MKLLTTILVFVSVAGYSSAQVAPLTVVGNKVLVGGKGTPLRGNSFFWSNNGWEGAKYYNADVVNWLKNDWKANAIRAVMGVEEEGGYLSDKESNKNRVIALVDAAIKEGIYILIDWQSFEAEKHQAEAIGFFQEMARKYGNYNNVIYEIYNEPKTLDWSNTIKPYAIAVIQAIRAIDPDNLIIVGTPSYSQNVDVAANDPIVGYKNIAYSLHFYAGTHKQEFRDKATVALQKNLPIFVSEFGIVNADGNGPIAWDEVEKWVKFILDNGLHSLNYSVCDKGETASVLKPGASPKGRWSENDLTESGRWVRDFISSRAG